MLYNVVLVSAAQQSESVTYIHSFLTLSLSLSLSLYIYIYIYIYKNYGVLTEEPDGLQSMGSQRFGHD